MSDIGLSTVSAICEVENSKFVNDFLDLGWKLIDTNNRFRYEYNPEVQEDEKVNFTCYILGWFGSKEVKYPDAFIANTSPF